MRTIMSRMVLTGAVMVFASGIALGAPMNVKVKNIAGKVEIQSGGVWKAATEGGGVPAGASLKTGPGSSCVLVWAGGNTAKVSALSNIKIAAAEKDASGRESTTIDIKSGKIVAHAKKLPTKDSSFKVSTPTAVAGVRGTDEVVEVSEGGESSFGVTSGSVELESGGESVVLEEGFMVDVDAAGSMSEPEQIPAEVMESIKEDLKEVNAEARQAEAEASSGSSEAAPAGEKKESAAGAEEKKESAAGGGEEKKESAAGGGDEKKEEAAAGGEEKAEKEEAEAEAKEETKEEEAAAEATDANEAEAGGGEVDMDAATSNIDSAMDTAVNADVTETATDAGEETMVTGDVDIIIDFNTAR